MTLINISEDELITVEAIEQAIAMAKTTKYYGYKSDIKDLKNSLDYAKRGIKLYNKPGCRFNQIQGKLFVASLGWDEDSDLKN